jgi:hypothetical protein
MRGREDGDNFSNEVKIHICHYESFPRCFAREIHFNFVADSLNLSPSPSHPTNHSIPIL